MLVKGSTAFGAVYDVDNGLLAVLSANPLPKAAMAYMYYVSSSYMYIMAFLFFP